MAISLTDKCDINCNMCCEKNNVESNIDKDYIFKFLESIDEAPFINNISFTGGEPFLEMEFLKDALRISKFFNKKTSVITNGNWSDNYSHSIDLLSDLNNIGLDTLGISYDDFHGEFVNVRKIINILKACDKLKMKSYIQICITKDTDIGGLLNDIKAYLNNSIINVIFCMNVGRTNDIDFIDKLIYKKYTDDILCQKGGSFLIGNSGKIYPCCSPMTYDIDLELGNIKDRNTIKNVLKAINNNLYLFMLRNFGFKYFINMSKQLDLNLPVKIVTPCDICAVLLKKNNLYKILPYIVEDYNKIARRMLI